MWAGILLAVVVVGFFGRGSGDDRPLDPNSTGPLGTKALVLLLGELGAQVSVGEQVPVDSTAVVVLLADDLAETQRSALGAWVDAGGTLVVADPFSDFAGERLGSDNSLVVDHPTGDRCGIEAVRSVGPIDAGGSFAAPDDAAPDDRVACFPRGGGFYLVAHSRQRGTVVALAGAGPFINSRLGHGDDAGLIAALAVPRSGTAVTLLQPSAGAVASGKRVGLGSLLSPRVRPIILQLVIAFVVLAFAVGRRLGRPVTEALPVELPGSGLTIAVGHLLQEGGHRDRAAALLRIRARRTLGERLGLGANAGPAVLAQAASAKVGLDRAQVMSALADAPVPDEDALLALAQSLDVILQEITSG